MTVPDRLHITTDLGKVGTGRWTSAGFENPFRDPVFLASTPAREHAEELVEALEKHVRWADGIRGAVESNQVADKDVRGLAIMMRDEMRALLAKIKEASNE